jgi:hypothetical protein
MLEDMRDPHTEKARHASRILHTIVLFFQVSNVVRHFRDQARF